MYLLKKGRRLFCYLLTKTTGKLEELVDSPFPDVALLKAKKEILTNTLVSLLTNTFNKLNAFDDQIINKLAEDHANDKIFNEVLDLIESYKLK